MVLTEEHTLPTIEELTVQEVNLSASTLRAASFHYGKACQFENNEFMLCRAELNDPRKCIAEGKAVTNCALNFFRKLKKTCNNEFEQYAVCIDKSSGNYDMSRCRKTQAVYDKCVLDNMGIERPEYDYFTKIQVHDSPRPKPKPKEKVCYPDATPGLPDDYPRPKANYGTRYIF